MLRLPKRRERPRSGILRAPPREFPRHRRYIRSLECVCANGPPGPFRAACRGPVHCCHVRIGTDGGSAQKPSDWWTFPACERHHVYQHYVGERQFEGRYELDLKAVALALARRSPDLPMRQAMREAGLS
jgi:hypothetical protein